MILSKNAIPPWVCVIMSILDALLFITIHYRGAKKMEFVFLTMISTMTLMFMSNMIATGPSYGDFVYGAVVPAIPKGSIPSCLGLVGAVI
jgi:Mn2+/Fe2+ NRAMP family transporter